MSAALLRRLSSTARLLALAVLILGWSTAHAGLYTDPQAWAKATKQDVAKARETKTKKKARPVNPAFAFVKQDPGLPNVLLIGDSISIGYTAGVRQALKGKANVYRIAENGGDTGRGVEKLDAWLDDMKWDVIHFNFGLHDLKHWKDNKLDLSGPVVNSLEQYEKNLRDIVARLKKTGARLIFATTTPVPEGSGGRVFGDEVKYNEVALKVMRENGVAVDDLCALVKPKLSEYQLPKNVHFTDAGYAALAGQVAGEIEKAMKDKAGQ